MELQCCEQQWVQHEKYRSLTLKGKLLKLYNFLRDQQSPVLDDFTEINLNGQLSLREEVEQPVKKKYEY